MGFQAPNMPICMENAGEGKLTQNSRHRDIEEQTIQTPENKEYEASNKSFFYLFFEETWF